MKYSEEIYKTFKTILQYPRSKVDALSTGEFNELIDFVESASSKKLINRVEDIQEKEKEEVEIIGKNKNIEAIEVKSQENALKEEKIRPFTIESVRIPPSDKEIIRIRKIRKEERLLKFRQCLFEGYEIEEEQSEKYEDKIKKMYKDLGGEPPSGYLISVVLVDGSRITRRFLKETMFRDVYIWVSAYEKVLKEKIRFGTFIIMDIDGEEKVPSQLISTLEGNRQLFFMRII